MKQLRLETRLNEAIYRSDQEAWAAEDREFPADRAHLALTLDLRDYRRLDLQGTYGGVGCGNTNVYLIDAEAGQRMELDDDGQGAFWGDDENGMPVYAVKLEEPGMLTEAEIAEAVALRSSVWDGNNHVGFVASRTLPHLPTVWEQLTDHVEIHWDRDNCPELRIADGWAEFDCYWSDYGNECWRHGASLNEIVEVLTAAAILHEVVEISPNDVMIVVPACDIERAAAVCTEERQ
jgi:hypothetical protein